MNIRGFSETSPGDTDAQPGGIRTATAQTDTEVGLAQRRQTANGGGAVRMEQLKIPVWKGRS